MTTAEIHVCAGKRGMPAPLFRLNRHTGAYHESPPREKKIAERPGTAQLTNTYNAHRQGDTVKFSAPLIPGTLIRRYKRFLADVRLESGETVTAHCANTGSMRQMAEPGSPVMLSEAANPERKTRYDWQLVMVGGLWAGINTSAPNILLREGFETGVVPAFRGFDEIRMEVKYGVNSRADALLAGPDGRCYVEAKNVTLVEDGAALFPDAVTSRGAKHLDELSAVVENGDRAVLFLLSQRMDSTAIGIASHIDPYYAERLRAAVYAGVEIVTWRARVSPEEIVLDTAVPFVMP